MSFSVASYFTCFPRASSAFATSASSPTEGASLCCHGALPLSTPLHRKTHRERRPLLPRTRYGAVPSAADRWRSSNDSPRHRSNSVLHPASSCLLHETTRLQPELSPPFTASRPSLSPFLSTTFLLLSVTLASIPAPSSTCPKLLLNPPLPTPLHRPSLH